MRCQDPFVADWFKKNKSKFPVLIFFQIWRGGKLPQSILAKRIPRQKNGLVSSKSERFSHQSKREKELVSILVINKPYPRNVKTIFSCLNGKSTYLYTNWVLSTDRRLELGRSQIGLIGKALFFKARRIIQTQFSVV